MHAKYRLFLLTLALFSLAARMTFPVMAQNPTGSIRGVVKDQQGAVILNATVTVANKATGAARTARPGSDGIYAVENLPAGDYEVKVEAEGFATQNIAVVVQVGSTTSGDANLRPGAKGEVIDVVADAPIIDKLNYKIDGVVGRKQIETLPLNGRNFLQLALLEPGVSVEAVDNPGTSPNNFFRVSVAGASQALTRISVDGATINDRVTGGTSQNFSQESVQEFQISTFNYDISTSVTSVGSINVISRSGTNDLHGSAFMYYRDHNMAAYPALQRNPREAVDPSLKEPFFARRQMGGSIGGPIKKDRVFFFFNYEHQNQDGVVPISNNHPIFSQFDTAFPQPLDFDQANLKVDFKVNDKNNAFIRFSTDNNDNFNSANGVFLPSNWVATKNVSTQALGGLTTIFTNQIVNDFRYSYSFYSGRLKIPTDECKDPVYCIGVGGPRIGTTLSNLGIGNNLNTPQNRVLRTYQLTDTLSWQKGAHGIRVGGEWEHFYGQGHWAYLEPAFVTLWDPLHILAFVAGTGGVNSPFFPLYNALPTSLKLNATGTGPAVPGLLPTYADILRLPLAGFATGVGNPGQPQPFNFETASHNNRYRIFAGDQWRIHPRLTLNFGVAWVYEDNVLNHDFDRPAYLSPLLGGDLSAPKRDKNNFDPTVGFAWDIKGNGKTVVRGGGGIYHDSNLFWTRLNERAYTGPSGNGRYIIPGTLFNLQFASFPTAYSGANLAQQLPGLRAQAQALLGNGTNIAVRGIQAVKTTGEQGFGGLFDPNMVVPYAANASIGIQRELAHNLVVQADFVLRRSLKFGGLHDTFIVDRNRFNRAAITQLLPNGRGSTAPNPVIPVCSGAQSLDPAAQCSTGPIAISQNGANFRYTGLHIKVDKRYSDRYLFTASYALSKFVGFNGLGNGVYNLDDFYEADDYQSSDRRHRFTFSGVVELPDYKGGNRFMRGLANRWQVSLINQMVSKPPLQLFISGVDLNGDGTNGLILPGATFRAFGRTFDKNDVRKLVNDYNTKFPTAVTGKRTLRDQVIPSITLPADFDNGDTFISQDIRLTRIIAISEKVHLQLIGEGFNVFNISNLSGYSGTLNGANFGIASSRAGGVFGSGGPRAFQVAARLQF
jgi:hypothetical protein